MLSDSTIYNIPMPYTAVIVESPSKCAKIEQYLGPGYKCIASFGHIRTIDHINCIDIDNNFEVSYNNLPNKSKQISKLQSFIKNADDVLLASDDDREGEAIAWHICQLCNLSVDTTKRIIFNEITASAIQSAAKSPKTINMRIVQAQQARQVLDIIVGFKISPILWKNISFKTAKSLSAGRCQTPALRLIYENQKEIDVSPGTKVYNTTGYFTSQNLDFTLNYNHTDEKDIENFLVKSSSFNHIYSREKVRQSTKKAPSPFTTSSIQQTCSYELKMSPKACMISCQKLYEAGYITYMRTDCNKYGDEFICNINKYIFKEYGSEYIKTNIDNNIKPSNHKVENAHEAIRPTDILVVAAVLSETISKKELKVYEIIRRNTLESCMPNATYNVLTAKISAPENYVYSYSSEQVIFPGWKIVAGYNNTNPVYNFMLSLKTGIIEYKRILSKATMKNMKHHYTEAKLVQLLEHHGIGRPSTFASLIDKIQERGYVKKTDVVGKKVKCIDFELHEELLTKHTDEREFGGEKSKLVIQPVGIMVMEFILCNYDALFNYDYTKKMEDTLDIIAKGEYVWYELCRACLNEIERITKEMEPEKQIIPIDKNHTYMIAKYGPVIKHTTDDGKIIFLKVKEDISIEILKTGGYALEDIIVSKKLDDSPNERVIGDHNGKTVVLKNGRYGLYLEWNTQKINIPIEPDEFDAVTMVDILEYLVNPIITQITKDISLRNGKFGPYIYYKTAKMKKPKFLPLDKSITKESSVQDITEWLFVKHQIKI